MIGEFVNLSMGWWVDGLLWSLGGLVVPLGGQKGAKGSQKEPKWRAKGPKGTQKEAKMETKLHQKSTLEANGGQGRKKEAQGRPPEGPQAFLQGPRGHPGEQNIAKVLRVLQKSMLAFFCVFLVL